MTPQKGHWIRKSYSLVELLIVVTIIIILASILFPSLKNAIDSSKSISCINNQKQTVAMLHIYTDDYNGFIPQPFGMKSSQSHWPSAYVVSAKDTISGFGHLIDYGYIPTDNGRKILLCPSELAEKSSYNYLFNQDQFDHQWGTKQTFGSSYIYSGIATAVYDGINILKIDRLTDYIASVDWESLKKHKPVVGFEKHMSGFNYILYDGRKGHYKDYGRVVLIKNELPQDLASEWYNIINTCEEAMQSY